MTKPKPTPKMLALVREYARNGFNGAEAYRVAYNSKANIKTATREAGRLLQNPAVAPLIKALRDKAETAVEKVTDQYAITKERILRELACLAFANITDYAGATLNKDGKFTMEMKDFDGLSREQTAAVSEIEFLADGRVKFKLYNKQAALVALGEDLGLFAKTLKVRKINSLTDMTDEEIAAVLAESARGDQATQH